MASLTSDADGHGGESGTEWRVSPATLQSWRREWDDVAMALAEGGWHLGSQETGRVVEDLAHVESLAAVAGSETVALRCRRVGGPGQH